MSDLKSKLPDFQEISSMACKFYKDLKTSVDEIVKNYKHKRAEPEKSAASSETKTTAKKASTITHAKKSHESDKPD